MTTSDRTPEDQASHWIARLASDTVSAEEKEAFERWRNLDARNDAAYLALRGTMDRFVVLSPLMRRSGLRAKFLHSIMLHPSATRFALTSLASVAAAMIVYFALQHPIDKGVLTTDVGALRQEILPDGSDVDLNTNTIVKFEFLPNKRMVWLDRGEAHFNVAHDTNRPFFVMVAGYHVRAVGTGFNVYLRRERLSVTVDQGAVEIAPNSQASVEAAVDPAQSNHPPKAAQVHAGQEATMANGRSSIVDVDPRSVELNLSWRKGILQFEDKTLDEVLAEVGRYTTKHLVLTDSSLGEIHVSGYFRTNDLSDFLELLEGNFPIRVEHPNNDTILFTRRST